MFYHCLNASGRHLEWNESVNIKSQHKKTNSINLKTLELFISIIYLYPLSISFFSASQFLSCVSISLSHSWRFSITKKLHWNIKHIQKSHIFLLVRSTKNRNTNLWNRHLTRPFKCILLTLLHIFLVQFPIFMAEKLKKQREQIISYVIFGNPFQFWSSLNNH